MALKKEQLELMVEALSEKIESAKAKIAEMEATKNDLLGQLKQIKTLNLFDGTVSTPAQTGRSRLGMGVPQKWVAEVMQRDHNHTYISLRRTIARDKSRMLNDSTVRRVMTVLEKEGKVTKKEDGSWEWTG